MKGKPSFHFMSDAVDSMNLCHIQYYIRYDFLFSHTRDLLNTVAGFSG